MCSAPNVYMFAYILIGTHMALLRQRKKQDKPTLRGGILVIIIS